MFAAAFVLTACSGNGPDVAACEEAMRAQYADAAEGGKEGSRPAECENVSDKDLERIVGEILERRDRRLNNESAPPAEAGGAPWCSGPVRRKARRTSVQGQRLSTVTNGETAGQTVNRAHRCRSASRGMSSSSTTTSDLPYSHAPRFTAQAQHEQVRRPPRERRNLNHATAS